MLPLKRRCVPSCLDQQTHTARCSWITQRDARCAAPLDSCDETRVQEARTGLRKFNSIRSDQMWGSFVDTKVGETKRNKISSTFE